jgi:asparagine synthase (glutamine-hydrolysing)
LLDCLKPLIILKAGIYLCICGYYGSDVANFPLPLPQIKHRGPDDYGVAVGVNFKFGYTRLSIADIPNSQQPMYNEDDSLCIVLNGEIYNYQQIREDLRKTYLFKINSEAEVIFRLYEKEGLAGLKKLDGMFALAIATPKELVMARDPIGIKPLYFQKDGARIYFASEMKAFTAGAEIEEFPPGTIFSTYNGFQPIWEIPIPLQPDPALSREDALTGLRNRLKKAVFKRIKMDVPLGSFLNGGLNSSLITALMKTRREKLYTFSVLLPGSQEHEYLDFISRRLGAIHHEMFITAGKLWNAIPEVIYYLESYDRFLVRRAVINYFLAQLAAIKTKVVFAPEGAEELFADSLYFNCLHDKALLQKKLRQIIHEFYHNNLQKLDRMTMAHGLEARVPFLDQEVVSWAMKILPYYKGKAAGTFRKFLLEAFQGDKLLPDEILAWEKESFTGDAGVGAILADMVETKVSDGSYQWELAQGTPLQSKEEYYYFQIFVSYFGRDRVLDLAKRGKHHDDKS